MSFRAFMDYNPVFVNDSTGGTRDRFSLGVVLSTMSRFRQPRLISDFLCFTISGKPYKNLYAFLAKMGFAYPATGT
ncbi:MAG TPA: hypothetical protein VJT71_19225 [Pyrinomonadaceae bacterium]|nr:hypothetical protein [Pyrinomonadaceae bacterium]